MPIHILKGTNTNTDLKDEQLYPFFQVFLIKSLCIIKHLDIFSRLWFHKLSTLSNFILLKHSYLDILCKEKCSAVNVGYFADLSNIQCIPRFLCGKQKIHTLLFSVQLHSFLQCSFPLFLHTLQQITDTLYMAWMPTLKPFFLWI